MTEFKCQLHGDNDESKRKIFKTVAAWAADCPQAGAAIVRSIYVPIFRRRLGTQRG